MRPDIAKDFPMLATSVHGKPLLYLDTAATAQKPACVIEALTHFYSHEYATVHRSVYSTAAKATQTYNSTRKKVASFIGAESPDEIIFTRGTTDAINLLAAIFCECFCKAGDCILLSELEHHSNLVPWQLQAKKRGLTLRFLPLLADGTLDISAIDTLLEGVKLVSLAYISNLLGTIHPVETIIAKAHAKGISVFLDAAQAAPQRAIDVRSLDVDFLAFSAHKLYGPNGVGVLYGKGELLDKLPPYQGGGDMIETVSLLDSSFQAPPLRFEAGTPTIAEICAFGACIDYLSAIGMKTIEAHEQEVSRAYEEALLEAGIPGLRLLGPPLDKRGAVLALVVDACHPLDLAHMLDFEGIAVRSGHHCAQPALSCLKLSSALRLSFGLYSEVNDCRRFAQALAKAVAALTYNSPQPAQKPLSRSHRYL